MTTKKLSKGSGITKKVNDISLAECFFAAEDVVVVLGEAVGFVADVLQEAEGGIIRF